MLAHWGRALTYKASYGFWGLVILVCWQQIGYMMIIYIAGLQALPTDVLEAAAVDGANASTANRMPVAMIPHPHPKQNFLQPPAMRRIARIRSANAISLSSQNTSTAISVRSPRMVLDLILVLMLRCRHLVLLPPWLR